MLISDKTGSIISIPDNTRLWQAIVVGAVRIDSAYPMEATIIAPPGCKTFTDEEILLQLEFANECGRMLEESGFAVTY